LSMRNKISLAGELGSGKSTVAALLKDTLGAEIYSTGTIVRTVAQRRGMTVTELNVYMETHPEIDKEIDDGLVALSTDPRSLIIDSRMAWHFTADTYRVYLATDPEEASRRIMEANRVGEHQSSLEETLLETKKRRNSEKKRYFERYGVDIKDLQNYDLVIDTTEATPEAIAKRIADGYYKWQKGKKAKEILLCPKRLYLPENVKMTFFRTKIHVYECDGDFYLVDGFSSYLHAIAKNETFVSVILDRGEIDFSAYDKTDRGTLC